MFRLVMQPLRYGGIELQQLAQGVFAMTRIITVCTHVFFFYWYPRDERSALPA